MFKKILVPTDGSPCSDHAVNVAADFAKDIGARLVVLSVVEPAKPEYAMAFATPQLVGGLYDALRSEAREVVEEAAKNVGDRCPVTTMIREGFATDEIVEALKDVRADLIVMGSHGRRGLAHLFIGSVAEGVLRRANVPVLIARMARVPAAA